MPQHSSSLSWCWYSKVFQWVSDRFRQSYKLSFRRATDRGTCPGQGSASPADSPKTPAAPASSPNPLCLGSTHGTLRLWCTAAVAAGKRSRRLVARSNGDGGASTRGFGPLRAHRRSTSGLRSQKSPERQTRPAGKERATGGPCGGTRLGPPKGSGRVRGEGERARGAWVGVEGLYGDRKLVELVIVPCGVAVNGQPFDHSARRQGPRQSDLIVPLRDPIRPSDLDLDRLRYPGCQRDVFPEHIFRLALGMRRGRSGPGGTQGGEAAL